MPTTPRALLTTTTATAAALLALSAAACAPRPIDEVATAPEAPDPTQTPPPNAEPQAEPVDTDRYTRHLEALRPTLPSGFDALIEEPFVVVGDEGEERLRERAESTVRWAVTRLKQDYFTKDPERVLTIWLFKDSKSYEKHTLALFGEPPSTPYGFYTSEHGALVMNISTGGGTLVHEIVHPFIEANFPACPSWFNEGLGSLYEQSSSREGRIIGLTNWRLAGLQAAIRKKRTPSFTQLMSTTRRQFYNDDTGVHYAQSRYLLYYLQEHDLLRRYYHEFHKNHTSDPTGVQTLRAVLGEDDLDAFQTRWEAWVLELRFP